MANKIIIKRTSSTGVLPNTTNSGNSSYIAAGELAINLTDKKMVSSNGSTTFEVGANLVNLSVTNSAQIDTKLQVGDHAGTGGFDFGALALIEGDGNQNGYLQVVIQNANTGEFSTSDFIAVADDGNDTSKYADFGINGSNYLAPTFTLSAPYDAYVYSSDGHLTLGSLAAKDIIFHSAGGNTENEVARFTTSGELRVGNSSVNTSITRTRISISNSTSTANLTAAAMTIGTTVANTTGLFVGANVFANSSVFDVGNTIIASALLTLGGQVNANGSVGTAGQVLKSGAAGNVYWDTASSGGTPGGTNTQVQFNDSGVFGGDAGLTYNKTTDALTIAGSVLVGANVIANTSALLVGNSTVNAVLTQSSFDIDGTIAAGNTTVTGFINVSSTANVGGAVNLRSTLAVNGAVTVSNTAALGNTTITGFANVSGAVFSGAEITGATQLATKQYVDASVAAGIHVHESVRLETAAAIPSTTYTQGGTTPTITAITTNDTLTSVGHGLSVGDIIVFNSTTNGLTAGTAYVVETVATDTFKVSLSYIGAPVTSLTNGTGLSITSRANAGVGAKLTNAGTQAALVIDGITAAHLDRVSIRLQANSAHNGIYSVSNTGSVSTNWELTRTTDANKYGPTDPNNLGGGDYFYTREGDVMAGDSHVLSTEGIIIFGTTNLLFNDFYKTVPYSGVAPINVSSTNISFVLPSASNTQVQFNDSATINSSAAFTFNKTSNTLTVSNTIQANVITLGANVFANSSAVDVGNTIITSALLTLGGRLNANGQNGIGGQVLTAGAGGANAFWSDPVAAGSNTQIQYNDSGLFGGSAGFTFNETTNNMSVANTITTANLSVTGVFTLATDSIQVGNSTVNTAITNTDFTKNGVSIVPFGQQTIWVPAVAMYTPATAGAAAGSIELPTNDVQLKTLDFDTTTQEFAQFAIQMPKSWDLSGLVARFVWSHGTTTTNFGVAWQIQGYAYADNTGLDTTFGTAVTVTDTGGTTNNLYLSPETATITIGGTPSPEEHIIFRVARVPANGSDNMAIDARLHGVRIHYTTNAASDT